MYNHKAVDLIHFRKVAIKSTCQKIDVPPQIRTLVGVDFLFRPKIHSFLKSKNQSLGSTPKNVSWRILSTFRRISPFYYLSRCVLHFSRSSTAFAQALSQEEI